MRTVTATSELTSTVTRPTYLISVVLDTTRYWSTRGDVTVLGQTWIGGKADLSAAADWAQLTIRIVDAKYSLHQIMLAGDWRGQACSVYLYLPDSAETLLLFSGELISADLGREIVMTAARTGLETAMVPRYRMSKPFFNHLPIPGSVFVWEGELYEVSVG